MLKDIVVTADYVWLQGDHPVKEGAILVDRDRVRETASVPASQNPYRYIKRPGMILPGFVDCHVHMGQTHPGEGASHVINTWDIGKKAGILAVRDAGDRAGQALLVSLRRGKDTLPLLVPAGKAISFKGGYGSFLGQAVSSVQEGVKAIDKLAEQGARAIKLMVTGLMVFNNPVTVSGPYLQRKEIKILTKAAHARGLQVMAHVNTDDAIKEALQGGVDSIEHGYFIADDTLEILASQGVAWIPTLSPLCQLREKEKDPGVRDIIGKTLEGQQAALRKAVAMKVLVGVGTDYVPAYSEESWPARYYRELELYHEAGLNWHQVLRAAAFNGYRILGLDPRLTPPLDINLLINVPGDMESLPAAGITLLAAVLQDGSKTKPSREGGS